MSLFLQNEDGKNFGDNETNCAIVTWTDWDMNVCLVKECRRKNLPFPTCLQSWVDIKYIYQKFYGRKPVGLNGALQEMGFNFEGRQHSGLCDAQNTAKLVAKMIQDGCVIGLTKSLNPGRIDPKLAFKEDLTLV
jgi:ERI1 exoribonuclease 2